MPTTVSELNFTSHGAKFIQAPRGCIYLITNLVTKQQYVGSTMASIVTRWQQHCKVKKRSTLLSSAIREYGSDKFSVFVLAENIPMEDLEQLERFYTLTYKTVSPLGYNERIGHLTAESTKLKLQKAMSGKKYVDNPKPMKGITATGYGNKPVIGVHIFTGEIVELPSICGDPRFDGRLVSACCRGKRRSHRGYRWSYAGG